MIHVHAFNFYRQTIGASAASTGVCHATVTYVARDNNSVTSAAGRARVGQAWAVRGVTSASPASTALTPTAARVSCFRHNSGGGNVSHISNQKLVN